MQKMLLRVVVPDGLAPGDDFTISAPSCCGAREFEVSVPKGACGGVTIDVEVPDDDDHRVIVVVPPGLQPGDPFNVEACLLYTSPSPRDQRGSRMPSSA